MYLEDITFNAIRSDLDNNPGGLTAVGRQADRQVGRQTDRQTDGGGFVKPGCKIKSFHLNLAFSSLIRQFSDSIPAINIDLQTNEQEPIMYITEPTIHDYYSHQIRTSNEQVDNCR